MKCQYCDSQIKKIPENGICPNCGAALPVGSGTKLSLEDYYYRFQPNRLKAIKALRKDTGMGLVEAKEVIDQIFDKFSGESQKSVSSAWENLKDLFK